MIVRLAFNLLYKYLKNGQLNVLLFAMLIAVASVSAIGIFAERFTQAMSKQSNQLLAADRLVSGSQPIDESWEGVASQISSDFKYSNIIEFNAMVQTQDSSFLELSNIKAVDNKYPLRGQIGVSQNAFGETTLVNQGPNPGEVWLSSRVMASLRVQLGDTIKIGETVFEFTQILNSTPDDNLSILSGGNTLIHLDDVPKTQALKPGSRARYKWLINGDDQALEALEKALEEKLNEHYRWREIKSDGENAGESVSDTLKQATDFFMLMGALVVALAAIAIAMASNRFAKQQIQSVALFKTLGLTPNQISNLYLIQLAIIATVTICIALVLGYVVHQVFITILADVLPRNLPGASALPFIQGALTGLICLFAFAFPAIYNLKNISPLQILRDIQIMSLSLYVRVGISMLAVCSLLWMFTQNLILSAGFLGVFLITACVLWVIVWLLIKGIQALSGKLPHIISLGLNQLVQQRLANSLQIMMFSLVLTLLFTSGLIRSSLIGDWQQSLPKNADNFFVYDMFEDETQGFLEWQQRHDIKSNEMFPIIRGRVIQINDQTLKEIFKDEPSREFSRELNLSWTQKFSDTNTIVAGKAFNEVENDGQLFVSIEKDWADGAGIVVGDTMLFSISGIELQAIVSSIRTVDWQSMKPNFYALFNQPIFEGIGAVYLTSFYMPNNKKVNLVELMQTYPTFTLIDLDGSIKQIQTIISQVSLAIEFILLLVLIAGFLVLLAAVQSSLDLRIHQATIMRAFGASKKIILGSLWVEFLALGLLSGLLAIITSEALINILQNLLFNKPGGLHVTLWFVSPIFGALVIACLGYVFTRKVVKTSVLQILRSI
ncbi:ABC transporter permease [Marinicellulosiphila megalodicopiae]|uniref:ABC transporter permease n=1 Tax=Marinicellulosiphila megalodicopiae TaxID=2724896 RepID=UPI003BAE6263